MPYLYAQAKLASRDGHPMLRTLFFEYPEDRTSWLVEDQYLLGTDLLVAPLLEEGPERDVYLPPGTWFDYHGGGAFEGTRWHLLRAESVLAILLAREGAAIPHAALAQSTRDIDWMEIELRTYGEGPSAEGLFCLPEDGGLRRIRLDRGAVAYAVGDDPLRGRVRWTVRAG